MDYICQTLESIENQILYQTFLAAFSDYALPLDLSFADYQKMLKRRGIDQHVSVGAFSEANQQLIGMMINGLREWRGKTTAYDLMTGVIPSYRKLGVTKKLFAEVLTILKKEKIEQYLLEVLQENHAAVSLYKKQGFEVTRGFSVFKQPKEALSASQNDHSVNSVEAIERLDWELLRSFWDFYPSWQNTEDSILAVQKAFACVTVFYDGQVVGYGLIDRETGDIPQLAVRPEYRRRGIGRSILSALASQTNASTISILNVEDSCEGMLKFLNHSGFKETTKQYEMILLL